jgi:hypothetical protein
VNRCIGDKWSQKAGLMGEGKGRFRAMKEELLMMLLKGDAVRMFSAERWNLSVNVLISWMLRSSIGWRSVPTF